MTVYDFRDSKPRSWLDYAAPIVMKLIGDGMERTNRAKEYELNKRTAEEEMARKQQLAQWQAEQLYGTEKSRPVSGLEQALGVAGYTPGGQLPAANETYREGGILNGLDMRGNQDDAIGRLLSATSYMSPEATQQIPQMLGNLNAPITQHEYNLGDRKMIGTHNPSSGEQNLQEYGVGLDPTNQYGYDKTLEGILAQVMGNKDVARINASRPLAPRAERKPAALRPIQTEDGIMLLDPETGEMRPTGFKPPVKGGSGDVALEALMNADQNEKEGGGFLSWLFGDSPAQATPTTTPQAQQPAFPGFSNFEQLAKLGAADPLLSYDPQRVAEARAAGWSDDNIRAWILANSK
jgi:hypothetical protein